MTSTLSMVRHGEGTAPRLPVCGFGGAQAIPGAARAREMTRNFDAPVHASFWSDLKAEGLVGREATTPSGRGADHGG